MTRIDRISTAAPLIGGEAGEAPAATTKRAATTPREGGKKGKGLANPFKIERGRA